MKIIKISFILTIVAFNLFNFKLSHATQDMNDKYYIFSESGYLKALFVSNNKIKREFEISGDSILNNAYWPCYDSNNQIIYFETKDKADNYTASIFKTNISKSNYAPVKLFKGRFPSLSTNAMQLAYYVHPGQLFVSELNGDNSRKIADDMPNHRPAIWVSKDTLLYMNKEKQLSLINISSGEKKNTGYSEVIPGSTISSDGEKVICGSYDGKKIFLYFVKTNEIQLLKKTKMLSMGTSFVWSGDEKRFLYTRQTWSNLFRLKKAQDLFSYSLDGNEIHLSKTMALFGGSSLSIFTGQALENQYLTY